MAVAMVLKAESRKAAGSAVARRLRGTGKVPAELYGGERNRSIQLDAHSFALMLKRHGEHLVMDLEIDGEAPGKVLIKAVQHDVLDGSILHADFIAVSMNKLIELRLPVHLVGEPMGAKAGGLLEQLLSDLEVSCLPGDIVESIPVDVSGLDVGKHLFVADLKLPAGLKAVTAGDVVVASVVLPGAEKAEAAEAVAAEAAPAAGAAAKAPAAGAAKAPAAGAAGKAPAGGAAGKAPAGGAAKAPAAKAPAAKAKK